jgi:hypothetical protein
MLTAPYSKRYTTDVLHSLVSQARDSDLRTMLPRVSSHLGLWDPMINSNLFQARQVAASSLNAVLRNPELCESLLIRHSPPENDVVTLPTPQAPIDSPIPHSRRIRTV